MEHLNEKENLEDNSDEKLSAIKTNNPLEEIDSTPNLLENNKCEICEKHFCNHKTLQMHIKTVHGGERNHKCDICGKAFAYPNDLKGHIRSVHEGIKDHKCDICGKAFSEAGILRRHIISVHEGIIIDL